MIRPLASEDFTNFIYFCSNRDSFSDFYITVDNKRLFLNDIKIAKKVFDNVIKHGDKIWIHEEKGQIDGVLLITGYSDKFNRKYIKIFSKSNTIADDLFRYFSWTFGCEAFLKLNRKNTALRALETHKGNKTFYKYGFTFAGDRGNAILLRYIPNRDKINSFKNFSKEED